MLRKDRYSHAIIMAVVLVAIALFLFSKEKHKGFTTLLLLAPVYLAVVATRSGRLNGTIPEDIQLKDEDGCGFTGHNPKKIDGLKHKGKRYKIVNGADVYVNDQGEIKPCGFGSAIMQKIGKGGYEPEVMQNNECWK